MTSQFAVRRKRSVGMTLFVFVAGLIAVVGLQAQQSLVEAVFAENYSAAKARLDEGVSPDDGQALAWAAVFGYEEIAALLIEKGADVDLGAPLVQAIYYERWPIVDLLLESGADYSVSGAVKDPDPMSSARSGSQETFPEKVLSPLGLVVNENYFSRHAWAADVVAHYQTKSKHTPRPAGYLERIRIDVIVALDGYVYAINRYSGFLYTISVEDVNNPEIIVQTNVYYYKGSNFGKPRPGSGVTAGDIIAFNTEAISVKDPLSPEYLTGITEDSSPVFCTIVNDEIYYTSSNYFAEVLRWVESNWSQYEIVRQFPSTGGTLSGGVWIGRNGIAVTGSTAELLAIDDKGDVVRTGSVPLPIHLDRADAAGTGDGYAVIAGTQDIFLIDLARKEVVDWCGFSGTAYDRAPIITTDGYQYYIAGKTGIEIFTRQGDRLINTGFVAVGDVHYYQSFLYDISCDDGVLAVLTKAGIFTFDTWVLSGAIELPGGAIVRASSTLPAETATTYRYDADLMFDGDPATAWSEGNLTSGEGERIEIRFPTPTQISSIDFMAGFFDARWFGSNPRVEQMRIELFDASGKRVYSNFAQFKDEMIEQSVRIPNLTISQAKFSILKVYPSGKWHDLSISEISFSSGDTKIDLMTP